LAVLPNIPEIIFIERRERVLPSPGIALERNLAFQIKREFLYFTIRVHGHLFFHRKVEWITNLYPTID